MATQQLRLVAYMMNAWPLSLNRERLVAEQRDLRQRRVAENGQRQRGEAGQGGDAAKPGCAQPPTFRASFAIVMGGPHRAWRTGVAHVKSAAALGARLGPR